MLKKIKKKQKNTKLNNNIIIENKFKEATLLHQRGDLVNARNNYLEVLTLKPNHSDSIHFLGVLASQIGNHQKAIEVIDRAISINPNSALYYSNRGMVLQQLKRMEEAVASYDKAIILKPDFPEAYANRGNALWELRRLEEAVASCDKAIILKPNYAEAYSNKGNALQDLKRYKEAISNFDKAIALKPNFAEAYYNRGNTLYELKRFEEAIASYDKAIALKLDYAEAYSNRGRALQQHQQREEAIANFDKAVTLRPDYAEAYTNRGNTLCELKRFEEAIANHDKAIALKPDFAEAYWNKSLTLLLYGKFEEGWRLYEWRWKRSQSITPKQFITHPLWLGNESIEGKTILIHSEQGLGDTIQFCRYLIMLAKTGARIVLEVEKSLVKLLEQLKGISTIVEKGQPLPQFDYHCPLLSLPLAFGTTLETIPSSSFYLKADEEKKSYWQSRLGPKTKLRVGLVWIGSAIHKNDKNRSLTLESLLPYLPAKYQYVCLQKEIREVDRTSLEDSPHILFCGEELEDFKDTAALCDLMDLIITVDTSVAHLSGALGKETRVLLPHAPDWRWLLDRDDSPWYPSVRLFRQPNLGNWTGALEKLQSEILVKF